ncbi:MAG: hypothetical protein NPIRA02_10770 [Nitrospirales bacterium]|nr:MAG: hypothetical protein NPIRA02_10770 [Nitrospirales bacterium]
MMHGELIKQVLRMEELTKGKFTKSQLEIYANEFHFQDIRDFTRAIDLCIFKGFPPRSPKELMDKVLEAKDQRLERERQQENSYRDVQSKHFFEGKYLNQKARTKEEGEYGKFRLKILTEGLTKGNVPEHVTVELSRWLDAPANAQWAKSQACTCECSFGSLYECVEHEIGELLKNAMKRRGDVVQRQPVRV